MLVQKYGETSLMTKNQIFGLLDAFSMNWLLLNLPLRRKIWKDYLKKLREEYINVYQISILKN